MLPETFRIWKTAGLRHILVEGGGRAQPSPVAEQVSPQPSFPVSSHISREASSPAASLASSQTSPVAWPPPWDRFRERLNRSSHSIWTYLALGEDMGGNPDPERRGVLTKIMAELGWPKGSIAFWPLAVLEEGRLCENTALFRQGVEYAEADHVVCFGEKTFRLLCPDGVFAPGEHHCPALPSIRSLLALPGLDTLSPDQLHGWCEALSLLRIISPA